MHVNYSGTQFQVILMIYIYMCDINGNRPSLEYI